MKLIFFIFVTVLMLYPIYCIGGGSWSEGKRFLFDEFTAEEKPLERHFRQQEKLQFLRNVCKDLLKNLKPRGGFNLYKVCKLNIPQR